MNLLRIDTPALRRLIEDDPDFKLQLTQACVAEVVRKLVLRDAKAVISMIEPEMMQAIVREQETANLIRLSLEKVLNDLVRSNGAYGTGHPFVPTKVTRAKLDQAFAPVVKEYIRTFTQMVAGLMFDADKHARERFEMVTKAASDKLDRETERLLGAIEERTPAAIEKRLDDKIEEEVKRRVDERLAAVFAALPAS